MKVYSIVSFNTYGTVELCTDNGAKVQLQLTEAQCRRCAQLAYEIAQELLTERLAPPALLADFTEVPF